MHSSERHYSRRRYGATLPQGRLPFPKGASDSAAFSTCLTDATCQQPLINIAGRAMLFWLIDRLELTSADTLYVAIAESVNQEFHLDMQLAKEYPSLIIKLIPLRFDTRGAAETLFIVTQSMTADESQRRTISLDCDTIYVSYLPGRALPELKTISLYSSLRQGYSLESVACPPPTAPRWCLMMPATPPFSRVSGRNCIFCGHH